jgi:flagellar biosynthesis protein FliQ
MTPEFISAFFWEALKTALFLAAPVLFAGLLAGVVVSMFQAATQINEMTLVFIPKMIAVGCALLVFFPWMMQLMIDFTQKIFQNIPLYIR